MSGVTNQEAAHVQVKINSQDGRVVPFMIKRQAKLGRLMTMYCEKFALEQKAMVFLYDGRYIKAKHTPFQLGMEDGDEIDAMLHQTGA